MKKLLCIVVVVLMACTAFAGCKDAPIEFTIEFYPNNGESISKVVTDGKTLATPDEPKKDGYIFDGWFWDDGSWVEPLTLESLMGTPLSKDTPHKVFAKWEAIEYTIQYDANGGEGKQDNQRFVYGIAQDLAANVFTRSNYDLVCWNTRADGSGTNYDDKQNVENLTVNENETLTLYAVWVIASYKINFDANGGSGSMDAQQIVIRLNPQLNANQFTKTGYKFLGWSKTTEGNEFEFSDCQRVALMAGIVEEKITLHAKWEAIEYTIQYDANGGEGFIPNDTFTYDVVQRLAVGQFARTHYSFESWNTAPDGNGLAYAAEQRVKNLASTQGTIVILYAQWKSDGTVFIYTADDLKNVEKNLSGKYVLQNDIDLGGAEWKPLGSYSDNFNGRFDGNNHIIKNFKISDRYDYAGLFAMQATYGGLIDSGIYNLGIVDFYVEGRIAGGLVGFNDAPIENCFAIGEVSVISGEDQDDYNAIAGVMVGKNAGALKNCYSAGKVTAVSSRQGAEVIVGGLAGFNIEESSIDNCFSTAEVSVTGYSADVIFAGGLVGKFESQREESNVKMCFRYKDQVIVAKTNDGTNVGASNTAGVQCALIQLNDPDFYVTTLEWSEQVWDFDGLDILQGKYPSFRQSGI